MSVNRVKIDSDNGLSPILQQAIISTNAGLLSIGPLGTNVSENVIKVQTFCQRKYIRKYHLHESGQFVKGEMG